MNDNKILIVDNEKLTREFCKTTLKKEGYSVEEAENGKLALKMLSDNKYDVVILDLKIADIDGITILKKIKGNHVLTDVIIVTVYREVKAAVDTLKMGAYDYVVKPLDPTDLTQSIRRCLKARYLSRKVKEKTGELERAYGRLKNIQEQIIQTERLRMAGKFASSIAHDLRNPLGIISSTAQLILSKVRLKGKFKEHLEVILRNAGSADKKVQDFLDFARPAEVSPKPCSINKILDETYQLIEIRCKKQKVSITRKFAPGLPLVVLDGKHVQGAFLNFILNSLDVMVDGGEIRIETDMDESKKNIIIRFADTGCGIPEDRIKKLFEPFFTTKTGSAGLGLTIARRIIEYYKGKITIESKKGKGTTVSVYIPVPREPLT